MKINMPVSQREVLLDDGATIVSKTDLKGAITFVNPEFIQISGFTGAELIGKNHNVVRHPDMPPEAFADLWATLKRGHPWTGLVKNRCKNGDHYWVNAHVSAIEEKGSTVGYTSMRTKASGEQIAMAEKLYEQVKAGKMRLHEGAVQPSGLLAHLNLMRLVSDMSVNAQIMLMLGMFMLVSALTGWLAYITFSHVQVNGPIYQRVVQGKDLVADILPPPEYLIEAYLVSLQMLNAEGDELKSLIASGRKLRKEYEDRHRYWAGELPEGKMKTLMVEDSYTAGSRFLELRDNSYIPALEAGDHAEAERVLAEMRKHYTKHRALIDQVVKLANARNSAEEQSASKVIYNESTKLLLLAAFGLGLVFMLGTLVARNVRKVLGGDPRYAREITKHVASGNLAVRVQLDPHDDSSLLYSIKFMQEMFRRVVKDTQDGANQVALVAQQMAASSRQVREAAHQSSSSASTMAAATEQMTTSMGTVVEHANEAHGISEQSEQTCRDGEGIIRQAVQSMETIAMTVRESTDVVQALGAQSGQISSVVKVIREIADQTNLLALNAAIEAARAGEQGRGFAVVADEVRKLAERTTSSTAEISKMVEGIQSGMVRVVASMEHGVKQVDSGVQEASQAGTAIRDIRDGSQRVLGVVADIASALREQGHASEQIAQHVEEIARAAEENSAVANEAATGADQLLIAATRMQNMTNRFAV